MLQEVLVCIAVRYGSEALFPIRRKSWFRIQSPVKVVPSKLQFISLVSHSVWPYTGSDVIRIPTMTSRDVIRTSTMTSIVWVWVCDTSLDTGIFSYQGSVNKGGHCNSWWVLLGSCYLRQLVKIDGRLEEISPLSSLAGEVS